MESAIQRHWDEPPRSRPEHVSHRVGAIRDHVAHLRCGLRTAVNETPIPFLPVSPETFARNRLVAALPENRERQAYCLLQAAVVQRLSDGHRVVGVTGTENESGKTLTTTNLAISLAVDGHRPVLAIDLDLRAPGVHELFDVLPESGVEDCLFSGVSVADALFCPSVDRMAVLPARGGCANIDQVLSSCHLSTLLETIETRYSDRIVLIDLPPVTKASDVQVFEAMVDGILLVIEDGVTRERDYRRALASFKGHKLLGTVLNKRKRA